MEDGDYSRWLASVLGQGRSASINRIRQLGNPLSSINAGIIIRVFICVIHSSIYTTKRPPKRLLLGGHRRFPSSPGRAGTHPSYSCLPAIFFQSDESLYSIPITRGLKLQCNHRVNYSYNGVLILSYCDYGFVSEQDGYGTTTHFCWLEKRRKIERKGKRMTLRGANFES